MTHGATDIQPPVVDEARRRRGMLYLGLAVGGVGFAMAVQMGLNTNFLVDEFGIDGQKQGLLEAVRESCGIIAFGVVALLAGFAEPLVGAAMIVLVGVGLGAYAFAPSFWWVIPMSLVWSQGLHVWMPLPQSITLSLAEADRRGRRLGQIGAAAAVGSGLGLLSAYILSRLHVSIRVNFLVAGAAALAAAWACLGIPRDLKTPGPRLVFRRRYGLYYLLCFLEGWRKQVFICFAPFLLVKVYGARAEHMLLLFGIIQVIGYFGSPVVGRMVDRVGERRILTLYYACIILVFVGYAFIPSGHMNAAGAVPPLAPWPSFFRLLPLFALFVLDSALFMLNMATTTYVSRIAPPAEHTPTFSMGVAMNHVAAVSMPFVGGILWIHAGMRWTFLAGALAAALSVLAAQRVPGRPRPANRRA